MALNFEKYVSEGNRFMHELTVELDCPDDKKKASRILKSVLHTLRDHLTIEESLQLLAQLPMFLKALYTDGWSSKKQKRIKHLEDFLLEIWEKDGIQADEDFGNGNKTLENVTVVFTLMRNYVSDGEMQDIVAILPEEIKPLIQRKFAF